jgi:hypothetical protein
LQQLLTCLRIPRALSFVEDNNVLWRGARTICSVFLEVAEQSLKRALDSTAGVVIIRAGACVGDERPPQDLNERPITGEHYGRFPGNAPRTIREHEVETEQ